MKINSENAKKILKVCSEQYFTDNGWKFFSVERDFDKVVKLSEDINRQYLSYPSISRDWYVQNAGGKSTHLCDTWDELKKIVDFLKENKKHIDFYVVNEKDDLNEKFKAFFVISSSKDLPQEQIDAILNAQKQNIQTMAFISKIPEEIETSVLQIKKSEKPI
ncbi:MAG: hypothetical protein GX362_04635 [Methanosarcinaceae archaeon]|nr:hypothetical protein [Methanosarcinaceae archaeon]